MPTKISQNVLDTGRKVSAAAAEALTEVLRAGIEQYLGWPYKAAIARVVDREGQTSPTLAVVVYVTSENSSAQTANPISADSAAAVIYATDKLTIDSFREAYSQIGLVKRLKKAPAPKLDALTTTRTLGIIFAKRSDLPLEAFAEELERLNANTASEEWPDMVVVSSIGVINYAVQFPGESLSGDFLPPAEGALSRSVPAMYVVIVMKPVGEHTFNRMLGFLFAHLPLFSPGAKVPKFAEVLEGSPKTAVVISGFQYNLQGRLNPVPRHLYQDRFLPAPPLRIEERGGDLLATIQFIPWQDGGAIVLRGKFPLLGLLPFFGKQEVMKAGVINRPNDLQISYVLPITPDDFGAMLNRFQARSNMVVRPPQGNWIIQKMADEGSSSPYVARLFLGLLKVRDLVYADSAKRDNFDKLFDFVPNSLADARTMTKDIAELWAKHEQDVSSGKLVRREGHAIHIEESIDKELRRKVEQFLNAVGRVVKQGMQNLASELGTDIGFLFKKKPAFERGIVALKQTDPLLADYLEKCRAGWSEQLQNRRNDLEHIGWVLPRVGYQTGGPNVVALEPTIDGQPVTRYVRFMLDRVCCFVEEVSAHCLQKKMPKVLAITEVKRAERVPEAPERFAVTLAVGGLPRWDISYHSAAFEEV